MARKRSNRRSIILFLTLMGILAFAACGERPLYHKTTEIPNRIWERSHTLSFDVEVEDTMATYDFYIELRNAGVYPYANIYLFINTTFPSGKEARDTVECMLANMSGQWLGDGLGDIWDNKILFKPNVRFPNKGIYTFEFEHGMRMEQLPAILDVGICIEPHRKR